MLVPKVMQYKSATQGTFHSVQRPGS